MRHALIGETGKRRRRLVIAIVLTSLTSPALSCARSLPSRAADCGQAAAKPVVVVELPGNPFQAIPAADGCHVFVSLVGPVEPGDPRRAPQPGAPKGGVAVVNLAAVEPSLSGVISLDGSPYGMALTHDGRLLIVASDDRVAFIDSARLIAGSHDQCCRLAQGPRIGFSRQRRRRAGPSGPSTNCAHVFTRPTAPLYN